MTFTGRKSTDCLPGHEAWVPHISLVFREMWVYQGAWTKASRYTHISRKTSEMWAPSFVVYEAVEKRKMVV